MKEFLDLYPDSGPNAGTGPWSRAHPIPFDHEPPTPDLEPAAVTEMMDDGRIADDSDPYGPKKDYYLDADPNLIPLS